MEAIRITYNSCNDAKLRSLAVEKRLIMLFHRESTIEKVFWYNSRIK
jgi:hypothetical protein